VIRLLSLPSKKVLLTCFALAILLLPITHVLSLVSYVLHVPTRGTIGYPSLPPNPPSEPPLPQSYDYIVYKSGNTSYVKDAADTIKYSDINARAAIQWAFDTYSASPRAQGGILVKSAAYEIDDTLYMRNNLTVVLENGVVIKETSADKWIIHFQSVQNVYLTSLGQATIYGLGSGGQETGIFVWSSNSSTISNIEIAHIAEELFHIWKSYDNLFENIYGHDYALGTWAAHGIVIDSSKGNYLVNVVVDAKSTGQSRSALLLIGNDGPCTDNVVIGGEFKNVVDGNGVYLCGWAYPVENNYLIGFIASGNKGSGRAGIKVRASSYNTITNFQSINNHNGIEVGTDYTAAENPSKPNSTGNYLQGIVKDNDNVGLILYIDKESRMVANNIFDLVLNNNINNGIWFNVGVANGTIENNILYVSSTNNGRNGISFDIDISSGYIRHNYFKGIFSNNTEYGIRTQQWSPPEYGVNFVDNRFDAVIENNGLGGVLDTGLRTRINKMAREAAGVGNPPTSSLWEVGDMIVNTDDNTSWIKDTDSIMKLVTQLTARFTFMANHAGMNSTTVQFIDQSYGPNGIISTWSWNFGDGLTSSMQNPIHVYSSIGNYTVTLTVINRYGNASSSEQSVIIRR